MGPGAADESFEGQQGCGSRILGQAVPGAGASAGVRAQVRVDLTGDVALESLKSSPQPVRGCRAARWVAGS